MIVFQGDDLALKQRIKELVPADKIQETHYTDPHMDRRLKLYREQNVHDSGASVQCLFEKVLGNDNVKVVSALDKEAENLERMQEFIERNGKPCCLNLITERDVKFLKQHTADQEEEDEDEVLKMIKREEEEQKVREEQEREHRKQEQAEAEQRKVREEQDRTKLEQVRQ